MRLHLGGQLLLLGSRLHLWVADLAMWIEPRLAVDERPGRRIRPWAGFAVLLLLVFGLAFVGLSADWAIRAALPTREDTP